MDSNDDDLEYHPAMQQRWGLSDWSESIAWEIQVPYLQYMIWKQRHVCTKCDMSFSVISSHMTDIEEALEAFGRHFVSFTLKSGYVRLLKAWEGRWRKKHVHPAIDHPDKLGKWSNLTIHLFSWFGPFRSFSYVMYIPIYWIFLTYISPLELAYMIILLFTKCSKSRLASALHASFILTPVEDGRIQKSCIHALNFPSNIVPWRLWVILSPHS